MERKRTLKLDRKVVKIVTILCFIITIFAVSFKYLLRFYLSVKYHFDIKDASSVGIIGGADGPTQIFISGSNAFPWISVISSVFAIVGIVYLTATKKNDSSK
jgi:Na+-transporting methylmalonyl-CoA/oxaloacetate decarboxylase beta subunit